MSSHELSEDPSDLRHDTPPVPSNPFRDTQENAGFDEVRETTTLDPNLRPPAGFFDFPRAYPEPLPRRIPDVVHGHLQYEPQGLRWLNGKGLQVDNLADPYWAAGVDNIELRTIHAHAVETAMIARAQMRERGMVVDF